MMTDTLTRDKLNIRNDEFATLYINQRANLTYTFVFRFVCFLAFIGCCSKDFCLFACLLNQGVCFDFYLVQSNDSFTSSAYAALFTLFIGYFLFFLFPRAPKGSHGTFSFQVIWSPLN